MATPEYCYYTDSTGSGTLDTTWQYWSATNATTTSTSDTCWTQWNTIYYQYGIDGTGQATMQTVIVNDGWGNWNLLYKEQSPIAQPRSAEDIQRDQENQRRLNEELKARKAAQAAAEVRAEVLLEESLSAAQKQEYKTNKHFTVISKDGERHYRVTRGVSHNIQRVDAKGNQLHTLCAHPASDLPVADIMLTQLLHLEHAEEDFLKIANVGGRR